VPVFTTAAAKGVLDESLVHSAGVFTGDGKELAPESHLLQEADLVVGLGLRNSEILSPKPFGRYTIMLDEAGDSFAEGFQPDVLLTDLELVPAVLEALQGKSWGLESLARVKRQLQQALLTGSWLPATCFEVLNALDYPYGMLLDTGSFCTIGEHLWEATAGRFFLGASNSRYMGTAIPSAIGMAVCRPTVPLFCVVGDGGMGMYAAEIKHAIEAQWAICFVLMTDGRYGSVACVPQPQPLSRRAVTVPQPSWWQAIDGMRCEAHLVHSSAAFEKVVLSWRRKGPLFIETRFDPTSYASMTERLR
jgi:thiamine pyrophosphate-dependent acetolactate synthase large subunit-like protein